MNSLNIHDIKSLETIPDISLYILVALLSIIVIVFVVLLYLIYKVFKNRNQNERKNHFKVLQDLDLTNSKYAAYVITKYSRLLISNEREQKLSEELILELENYKYKKEVEPFNKDVQIKFELFMETVDV